MPEPVILMDDEQGDEKQVVATGQQKNSVSLVDVNSLLTMAIEKGTPVETMERLMAMAKQLKDDFARDQFNAALSNFQADCPEIVKTVNVKYKSKSGAMVYYNYAPVKDIVKQVKPIMQKHGLSHTYNTTQTNEKITVICTIRHIDGHSENTQITMPIDNAAKMCAAQKIGTAFTYGWRYTFCGALGITTGDEDTDANGPKEEPKKQGKPKNKISRDEWNQQTPPVKFDSEMKDNILLMLKNDTQKVFSDDEKNEIRKRIADDKPYSGGWEKLESRVRFKIEKETVAY